MRRELLTKKRGLYNCCPGHDKYPGDTYSNRRSKKARSRGKKAEHQYARTIAKQGVLDELREIIADAPQ